MLTAASLPISHVVPAGGSRASVIPFSAGARSGKHRVSHGHAVFSVLLVEDNAADAMLVTEALDETSVMVRFHVQHVSRLRDALDASQLDDADVVLLDLGLPDARGLDGVLRLRSMRPDLPIVVLTGNDQPELWVAALKAGAQDYLAKGSLETSHLGKALIYAIERARAAHQLRLVVSENADAALVVSGSGVVQFANQAAADLFGCDSLPGRQLGVPCSDSARIPIDVLAGDGRMVGAEMWSTELEWAGERTFLTSIRDTTDQRRAAELSKRLAHADRLASLGQLAAGVAHEVNNPASAITANLTLLAEQLLKLRDASELTSHRALWDYCVELSTDSLHGIERITEIVRDLKSYARSEQGTVEPTRMVDVARFACGMVRNEIRHRARLSVNLQDVPPILANRGRLIQVLVNLLVNAAQSIEPGNAEANVIAVTVELRGVQIVVRVSDTGCGISAASLPRVFDPFFTTKDASGTGLGLALAQEIVNAHGGRIHVSSGLSRGTTFEVTLPLDTGLSCTEAVAQQNQIELNRRVRVLVVDDDPMVRRALQRSLASHHDIVLADGAKQALELLRTESCDAILCDLMMPEMDGVSFYHELGRCAPALQRRVVFTSGGAFSDRIRDFLSSAGVELLDKPSTPAQVLDAVARVVGRS